MMPADFEGAKHDVLRRLEREIAPFLTYHNLWHTRDEVLPQAARLAQLMGVRRRDLDLVKLGAAAHDVGFLRATEDHERVGAEMVEQILPRFGLSDTDVLAVRGMILATKLPQSPHNLLEEIVADADLDSLGREDFLSRSLALRAELEARGTHYSDATWFERQLAFLESHTYFTSAAQLLRGEGERHNIDVVRRLLAEASSRRGPEAQ